MTTQDLTATLELISAHGSFGGSQRFYRHRSSTLGLPARFSIFLPRGADAGAPVPALIYLAGLTCNEETFPIKSGAQRFAAEHGLALIAPDTSPRGAGAPGETDNWDLGVGAGFYLDATQPPWNAHYRMESYVVDELVALVTQHFNIDAKRIGVFGHSMGGHGALTLALRHPSVFRSVSAFAPVAAPASCPWGEKAFGAYLGDDRAAWRQHDATALIGELGVRWDGTLLVDQGLDDGFLASQLRIDAFEAACRSVGQPLELRRHAGYDHGYYFISTFIGDHIAHHARALKG
ncbi:S-formylglutathione hydrolase [Pararobbsia silviterrae]|uniref:S-formylglutathione hydrolase n=1 Tax=Pararobbsia silviterrae TaxID=1792498 RepID=A0A494XAD1_9BURK|nr:S-formylglutathione hydrolase [Pararobbsia silviterrae]RKP45064.1 S-formylglutathione hydrolase [Pararobbsia silviterrae]